MFSLGTHNISAALFVNTHWIRINCLLWSCMTLPLTESVCITVHIPQICEPIIFSVAILICLFHDENSYYIVKSGSIW